MGGLKGEIQGEGERVFQKKKRTPESLEVQVNSGEFRELLVVQHGWRLGSG